MPADAEPDVMPDVVRDVVRDVVPEVVRDVASDAEQRCAQECEHDPRAELDSQAAIEHTLSIIGDRWSLMIVRASLRGLRRFDEFVDDLGIARPVLTDRLKRLVGHGVLEKQRYQDRPARYEYRLTEAGLSLSPVLVALVRWSEDHVPHVRPSTKLVHGPCGTELEQAFWCRRCATTFGPAAIRGVRRD